ncbi:DUF502 domain-containing protein [Rubellicoccus peritrichatus]|uniref:DUF502 domain-containing protein n=1 Tax=Rubellicoccus peritrichatus TaxID=3080537 RepID=A0AAQ3QQK7_9BACT|nr:DUF502 domain-containing protein [Puniceicoccus sp. CR14]WOO40358.1 DUF502 domain-containing protein [Puniceicoccus sp. CR14]
MFRSFRNGFIAGLVLLAPLAATIFVVNLLRERIGRPMNEFLFYYIDPTFRHLPGVSFVLDVVAILVVVIFITGLGFLSNYVIGKFAVRIGERLISAVPFVNSVYKTVKQIVDTFSRQQKAVFQKVVLTEYPRKGVYVLGFLTSEARGEVQAKTGAKVINIFVPTTPNPTSGFLLMVPKEEVIDMDMSVADGMKLIVSGGAVSPEWKDGADKPESVQVENPQALNA